MKKHQLRIKLIGSYKQAKFRYIYRKLIRNWLRLKSNYA